MFLGCGGLYFDAINPGDLPQLAVWRNQEDLRSRTREFAPLNQLDQDRWLESLRDRQNIMFLLVVNKLPIGAAGLTHIDWKNRSAEVSLYIGEKGYRGKGYGGKAVYLLQEYAFDECGIHRLWGECYSNTKLINFWTHVGFRAECTLRSTYWWDGKWWDSHFFSLLDSEWAAEKFREVQNEGSKVGGLQGQG